jgi:hypothetical protein
MDARVSASFAFIAILWPNCYLNAELEYFKDGPKPSNHISNTLLRRRDEANKYSLSKK